MSASERAAQLRDLADAFEAIGDLETSLDAARDAYRANPSEKNKDAYAAASEALRAARKDSRESGVLVAPGEPGSVAIQPQAVKGKAR